MKVIINKHEIDLFKGATIKDLVLKYSERSYKMLLKNKLCVFDRFGNKTENDGPVYDGQMFFIKRVD